MKKQALMALYGGSAAQARSGGDQETREEYNARKKRSKPKAKVLETAFVIVDAADRPVKEEETAVVVEPDSSSDGEEDLPRRRVSSSSSEGEEEKGEVDSDGDVKARRRLASSSSSSSEEEEGTHGLKQSHEFQPNNNKKPSTTRSSAQTVFRDKKTGLATQPPNKDDGRKDEEALLEFELNMGSMDKLRLLRGGVEEGESAKAEVLEEMDPMAQFLSRDDGKKKKEEELTATGKPKFKGARAAPTRFGTGIPPGYRWDGVDRSNGFELQLINSRVVL
ncbi:hypothetical protein BASA81_017551 [Batrachochytrium salamandrivorans]|nr:hypothetical protein BASA81_017551 [Batrachochytrium salamandrivorans]